MCILESGLRPRHCTNITTLVSESAGPTTMEESTTTGSDSHTAQESHRRAQCQGCLQLKKARKELKRVRHELRAARQLAYSEQQRSQRLQDLLDLTATEVNDLKWKLGHIDRSTSGAVEGWFDVCADFKRRTRRRPSKSRGITWQRRYLVARSGRLFVCRAPGVWDEELSEMDTATLIVDIDDNMVVSSPGPDDPEVFLLNRDHQKVIRIVYHKAQPSESSSASDCSESTPPDTPSRRVLMLEASSVEEKQLWLTALSAQRSTSTATALDDDLGQHGSVSPLHHQVDKQLTGSLTEADVNYNFRFRKSYIMRCLKVRRDSEGSQLSSAGSSQIDADDFEESETPKCSQSDNDDVINSYVDEISDDGSDLTDSLMTADISTTETVTTTIHSGLQENESAVCFRQVDNTKLAVLLLSVIVATAALILMSHKL